MLTDVVRAELSYRYTDLLLVIYKGEKAVIKIYEMTEPMGYKDRI